MKILLASTYLPPRPGGAERVVWETAKRLAQDHDVHLLTTEQSPEENAPARLAIHRVPDTPAKPLFYTTFGRVTLKRIMEQNDFDAIHCHIALPWGYLLRRSKKLVITCHGSEIASKGISKWMAAAALRKAEAVTAPSSWLAELVHERYAVKCCVIPNGVDTQSYRPSKDVKCRENVVLYVGRLLERKGVLELVQAAKVLKNYEFWIAGEGPLKNITSLHNIKWLGFVQNLADLYNRATICVFPSQWEPFGMVALEAMACEKAVVATNTGFSDFIEHSKDGVLVTAGNLNELISSITSLMEDRHMREKIGKQARSKALAFDWRIITRIYERLYEDLISRRPREVESP